jgi:thioredoxin reductase
MTQPFDLPLHGRLARSDYLKEELIELWEGIRRELHLDIVERVKLLGLEPPTPGLHVLRTSAGPLRARTVILALGRRGTPRRLGVPGEESEKVLYQLVDAASYTGRHILVVGGGDSAVEAAIALAEQAGNVVTLSYRNAGFTRVKPRNEETVRRAAAEGRVSLAFSSKVDRIESGSVVLAPTDGAAGKPVALRNDHVFVFAGGEPPYPILKRMGIRFGGEEPVAA